MSNIKFYNQSNQMPVEMHKVRVVQKLELRNSKQRLDAITQAGYNTFLLQNKDVFLDMLTDSGVNAMSDLQVAASMRADDSYAGSATFTRLSEKLTEIFGTKYFLPAHQGRACENIISRSYVSSGKYVPMNFHFTTSKSHVTENGGIVEEFVTEDATKVNSDNVFKGNVDIAKLEKFIKEKGAASIAYVRMETGTNLIGGQPHSLQNLKDTYALCKKYGVLLVFDASLLADNLYFIKTREAAYKNKSIREITLEIAKNTDIIYFSARKLGCARGGAIITNNADAFNKLKVLIPLFEGFLTYGGMSVREMEAIAVGLDETMDFDMISQGPSFISHMVNKLQSSGVPVVTPAGGLGCHLNAMEFVSHIPQDQYPSGALAAALYIASGVRGMERGTLSEARNVDGTEHFANMELVRLALPRRVFTISQISYAVDRIQWLYQNRKLIDGLEFTEEPSILRFFLGRLKPKTDWATKLQQKFAADFGTEL